jgi:hypothetical protein
MMCHYCRYDGIFLSAALYSNTYQLSCSYGTLHFGICAGLVGHTSSVGPIGSITDIVHYHLILLLLSNNLFIHKSFFSFLNYHDHTTLFSKKNSGSPYLAVGIWLHKGAGSKWHLPYVKWRGYPISDDGDILIQYKLRHHLWTLPHCPQNMEFLAYKLALCLELVYKILDDLHDIKVALSKGLNPLDILSPLFDPFKTFGKYE